MAITPNGMNGNDPGSGDEGDSGFDASAIDDFSDDPLAIDNSDPVTPPGCCTACTGDHQNNMFWREGAPGYPGHCLLDQMDYMQVFVALQRIPKAREDLLRITDNKKLIRLAKTTRLSESYQADDQRVADRINANTLPFYTVMYGNTGGNVTGRPRGK